MKSVLKLVIIACTVAACTNTTDQSAVNVEIVKTASGYQLMRDGSPYTIKGAGMAIDDIERFASHGGNSIRNWTVTAEYQDVQDLLDSAHEHGVTVALCLPMQAERWGFDYGDTVAVAAQLEQFREEVLKYRDHPALLVWIIGNELNHHYTDARVYDAVNDVAAMIHELDPNHPTTTTVSGFSEDVIADIETRAPNIDFVSFQLYGGLFSLTEKIADTGYDRPFMVTEWGALGYWEMDETDWGAPTENTSSEKAGVFLRGYQDVLSTFEGQLLGSYVFLWGQKQERTPTWFGMFTEAGEETETVDVMHYIWNGAWPENRSPHVRSLSLDNNVASQSVMLVAGQAYQAKFDVVDPDDDVLRYDWELKPESDTSETGGDFEEAIASLDGLIADPGAASTSITVPEPGKYRLFAYAYDDAGHAAHANIPFLVTAGDDAKPREFAQQATGLLSGEVMAIAYSGFREGQHPDRGDGAVNPADAEILEDLQILAEHDFGLIRMYDTGENTEATLRLIHEHGLPIKVLLGIWLRAEFSNHEGCPWLDEPIPDDELAANTLKNVAEVERGIELARQFEDIVIAVNVGNEALVEWNDHMVPLEKVITYVRTVKDAIEQPVTVAENYEWWIRDGAPLAAEVDFLGVHTYALWEEKGIDDGFSYTVENVRGVHSALPDKPIAILEAGWASIAEEFGERANVGDQARYFSELYEWAEQTNTTVFFFEAFDEPWKGDPDKPLGAEKHWGVFNVDRTPKLVMQRQSGQ